MRAIVTFPNGQELQINPGEGCIVFRLVSGPIITEVCEPVEEVERAIALIAGRSRNEPRG